MIASSYIDDLPDDPLMALFKLAETSIEIWNEIPAGVEMEDQHREKREVLGDLKLIGQTIVDKSGLRLGNNWVEIDGLSLDPNPEQIDLINESWEIFKKYAEPIVKNQAVLERKQDLGASLARYGNDRAQEFTDGDLKRIQVLINELRDQISASNWFEGEHKVRVMAKLEKLQMELHKNMSTTDYVWSLLEDAGIAIGKFGTESKPFVDRVRELAEITWRANVRAAELESDTPLRLDLKLPDEDEQE